MTATIPDRTTVTQVPDRSAPGEPQVLRRVGGRRASDTMAVIGAVAAGATTAGLLWSQFMPLTGAVGYVVSAWLLFIGYYAMLLSFDETAPIVRDRLASAVITSITLLVLGVLLLVVGYTFARGWHALWHVNFFTQDLGRTLPTDPLTKGGIVHAILGTLIEVGIALAVTVPLGVVGAVFLHEVRSPYTRFVRTVVDAMTALPDVLAGLFIYATLILLLGWGQSGFAAACALAITILPIIIRAGEVVLRLTPAGLKEASYALGATQTRTVWHVLLPTSRSGLVTAVILGAARAVGETSPVLLTAGVTLNINANPFSAPMMSLPLEAFVGVQSSQAVERARGFGAAATLLVLVLLLFAIARVVGGRSAGDPSARQQRRHAHRSRADFGRIYARATARQPGPITAVSPLPNPDHADFAHGDTL